MSWFKVTATFYDAGASPPQVRHLELQGPKLSALLLQLSEVILTTELSATEYPLEELISMLLVPIEVTRWTSLKSCGKPGQRALAAHQLMRESVATFLSSGDGSPSPDTETDPSASPPR